MVDTQRIRAGMFSRKRVRKMLEAECKGQALVFWTEDWDLCWSTFTISGPPIEVRRIVNIIDEWMGN